MGKKRWNGTFALAACGLLAALCLSLALPRNGQAAPGSAKTCYRCHEDMKRQLAGKTLHAPLKDDNCAACHNPHASESRHLLSGPVEQTCYHCHARMQKEAQGKQVHTALRQGPCTQCHDPHAGGRALLKQDTKALCLSCHQGLEKELRAAHQNPPFAQGKCLSCHEAHYAGQPNLLRQDTAALCLSCHEPRCKANGVSIAALTRKMECTGCHSPHASDNRGLLGSHGHKSFLKGECGACHGPASGGGLPLKEQDPGLCLSCHKKEAGWLERPNQHVIDSQPCTRCHNPHAARSEAMLAASEGALCFACHADTQRRMVEGEKAVKARCEPIIKRQCSACHEPHASSFALYFKGGRDHVCQSCHKRQHRITHPLGEEAIDHRNREQMQCVSCHKMHGPTEQFMLYLDGKRALCIECHKY